MSAEHTPGPWEWDEAGRLLHNVPASHSSTVLLVHDRIWRPTEADARLIASAPELLEALIKIHRVANGREVPGTKLRKISTLAADAIAKATGAA